MADRSMAVAGRPRDWRSPGSPDRLAPQEREFVAERDSFFMASVGARLSKLARPPDLRRSFSRPCHAAGGELEQIQFQLGHEWLALP